MPIYEYVAEQCRNQPPCSRRKEYLQSITAEPLAACRLPHPTMGRWAETKAAATVPTREGSRSGKAQVALRALSGCLSRGEGGLEGDLHAARCDRIRTGAHARAG